ncbi:MAG: hypothetical protein O2954_07890 [bacterium]|nr:hypothetical protein [bacterium]
MPTCAHCGMEYENESRYCSRCGRQVSVRGAMEDLATEKALDITDVRYKLGMVFFKQRLYKRAIEVWQKILDEHPGDGDLERLIQDARDRQKTSGGSP